ncbi:MAG: hypothetical protein JSV77_01765 [Dehalococcoidales bacterium]|nr:MAG: hypothetical protein JSV77_01765 [Dehalococcoidales bacterium]
MRKLGIWLKITPALLLVSLLCNFLCSGPVLAWGATTCFFGRCMTHQYILRAAYELLENDPAFVDSGFPGIEEIVQNDGIDWQTNLSMDWINSSQYDLLGEGPDDETKTAWSDHFYNPELAEGSNGNAPMAAKKYFIGLCQAMYGIEGGEGISSAKGAAWSAHFLADMFVPYHVIGMLASEAIVMNRTGNYILDEKITGPAFLYGRPDKPEEPPSGWGSGQNFYNALRRYVEYHNDVGPEAQRDWFDPWYLNGPGFGDLKYIYSSHVGWEEYANAQRRIKPYDALGVPDIPVWLNRYPTWETIFDNQAELVEEYCKKAAKETRDNLEYYWQNPEKAIDASIESVYTLWRSTISALKPQVEIIPVGSEDDNIYQVRAIIRNVCDEVAQQVLAKITVTGGVLESESIISIAEIANGVPAEVNWDIQSDDITQCQVVVEVMGVFEHTPDLQYAVARPEPVNTLTISVSPSQVYAGGTVTVTVQVYPRCETGLVITGLGPLRGPESPYYTDAEGWFSAEFEVDESTPANRRFTISVEVTELELAGTASFQVVSESNWWEREGREPYRYKDDTDQPVE